MADTTVCLEMGGVGCGGGTAQYPKSISIYVHQNVESECAQLGGGDSNRYEVCILRS